MSDLIGNTLLNCTVVDGCAAGAVFNGEDIKEPATPTPSPEPTDTPLPTNTPLPPTATPTPPAGVRMEKDCNADLPGVQNVCNLWITKLGCTWDEDGNLLTGDPLTGKGCLEIDVCIFAVTDLDNPNDSDEVPEGLGAWEHKIFFDSNLGRIAVQADNTWLLSGGRKINVGGVNGCFITIMNENSIIEGCVTKDDPALGGEQAGPQGEGIIERITFTPNLNYLLYGAHFRPTKDNGVLTNIVDKDCEVTDTQAEQIQGTLPGGLTPTCGNAYITIRFLEGDLNMDCVVDVLDDQAIAFRYGASLGLQLYMDWYDLEPKWMDQDIDIKDLQFVFGRNYSTCEVPLPDDQSTPMPPIDP
jgi:hypothetical protein